MSFLFAKTICAQRVIPCETERYALQHSIPPKRLRYRSKVDPTPEFCTSDMAHARCGIYHTGHSRHWLYTHGTRPMSTSEVTDACEWPLCRCLEHFEACPAPCGGGSHNRSMKRVANATLLRFDRYNEPPHPGLAHSETPDPITLHGYLTTDVCEWPQCGCLSTVRLAPHHVVVGHSPDRWSAPSDNT